MPGDLPNKSLAKRPRREAASVRLVPNLSHPFMRPSADTEELQLARFITDEIAERVFGGFVQANDLVLFIEQKPHAWPVRAVYRAWGSRPEEYGDR